MKSVSPGSAADVSGRIHVNDRIIEVDHQSLQGYSNHQAVEVLKKSGQVVTLCLERYLRGPKFEQLQQAIAANELKPSTPGTPPPLPPLSTRPTHHQHDLSTEERLEDPLVVANRKLVLARDSLETRKKSEFGDDSFAQEESTVDDDEEEEDEEEDLSNSGAVINQVVNARAVAKHKYYVEPVLTAELEASIRGKWQTLLANPDVQVIVAQIRKFSPTSGLGISLEGTVDVEGGREVRPHHYIRSILPEGPVGKNGLLQSADELLEVNGQRLLGLNHLEVVAILKELPQDVRMVCGRERSEMVPFTEENICNSLGIDVAARKANLDGSGSSGMGGGDRLVKAKSDGSLATGSGVGGSGGSGGEESFVVAKMMKSRSLEPLTGLAMWSSEPQIIELVKGERGLGFSILDYQDPMDANDTLIVIRSLVPGGVAQMDGRLIPGDRLLFVNEMNLENASLDQAVQALKGAQKGVVRIGVAKPLPMAAGDGGLMELGSGGAETSSYIEKILSSSSGGGGIEWQHGK